MKQKLLATVAGAALVVIATIGIAQATPPDPNHKVTLCHRTGSATNPYVVITTDIASDGYVKGGHTNHDQIGNGLGGDIIPAYVYVAKNGDEFDFPGKNLDFVFPNGETGAEVLAAGCVLTDETPPPTSPPPTSPPPTSPPPTSPPPTSPPPSGGHHHHSHTPTWTPTWHPTWTPAGPRKTAFTGGRIAGPAAAAGVLASLGLGLTYLARRRVTD